MVLSLLLSVAFATNVTISNVWPRHNTTGSIIDAHDGTYNRWTPDGPWYYYAMVRPCDSARPARCDIYILQLTLSSLPHHHTTTTHRGMGTSASKVKTCAMATAATVTRGSAYGRALISRTTRGRWSVKREMQHGHKETASVRTSACTSSSTRRRKSTSYGSTSPIAAQAASSSVPATVRKGHSHILASRTVDMLAVVTSIF